MKAHNPKFRLKPESIGLLVMMANGPLDHAATDATHAYLIQASKARDARQAEAAKQNRPKL